MITETKCSTHPDAPHGFDRNGSHMAGHYVCECSGWTPSKPRSLQERLQELADNSLIDYHTPDSRNRRLVQEAADRIDLDAAHIATLAKVVDKLQTERDGLMLEVERLKHLLIDAEGEV